MTTATISLAERLESKRGAGEALDTIISALAMLNGEVTTPAPLGRREVLRDLRSSLVTLHVMLGVPDAWNALSTVPNLRASLLRCKLLDEALEGPPTLDGIDRAIETLRELSAEKDRRMAEINAELAKLDEDQSKRAVLEAGLASDAVEAEHAPIGFGRALTLLVYLVAIAAAGYGLAAWILGV